MLLLCVDAKEKGDRVQHNRLAIVSCVQLLCARA